MRTRHSRKLLTSALLMVVVLASGLPMNAAVAQDSKQVTNVRFEVFPDLILVYYDLGDDGVTGEGTAQSASKQYAVTLLLRKESDPSFSYTPKYINGDVGKLVSVGTNRKIQWNAAQEFPDGLEGSDYFFEVRAEPRVAPSNLTTWLLGGGAAILGGTALYLILSKGGPTTTGSFPTPPGRPQ
ncbi:MAG: hypothetical protein ACRDGA_12060 [Bacteroidota bacterium]